MNYPTFFDSIESIKLKDPLAQTLGAFFDGVYEITYLEVVKSAGHSCPTVAGAYLMTQAALKELFLHDNAVRGTLKVEFKEDLEEGVAGVIANVVSQITGATDKSGFKGLNGKFSRHSLMNFNANITSSARFTRVDNKASVDVTYDPSSIKPDQNMMPLMQKMISAQASPQEIKEFGVLWQDRVERIFENSENVVKVKAL